MTDIIAQARVELMTPDDLAQMLHVAASTLATWRHKKTGPTYTKLGKQVFYRRTDVEAWIAGQTVDMNAKQLELNV